VRIFFVLLLIVTTSIQAGAQSYTIESVPNTKLTDNSYVSNPDKILSDAAVTKINTLLDSLEKKTTAQVAVVILTSIGDADVFEFAQSLFEKWRIGKSGNDNGLLILYVQDQRTVRFHTGFGLEGVLPDATCKRIQTQKMVPHFKEGNTDAGMIAGVEEVVKILTGENNRDEVISSSEDISVTEAGAISFLIALVWMVAGPIYFFIQRKSGFANSKNFQAEGPHSTMTKGNWWLWYYLFPLVLLFTFTYVPSQIVTFGSMYGFLMLLAAGKYNRMMKSAKQWLEKGEYRMVYDFYEKNKGVLGLAFLFPIPFALLISGFKKQKLAARRHSRPCTKCNQLIQAPLSESEEDKFLTKESIFEEELKSVDYDVWRCSQCGDFHYEMYVNPKTKFTQCPKCNTHALYTASTSTKVAATTYSTGTEEIIKQCKFCNKKTIEEVTIPMISTSSDSSSSSSDSGGSWGGGDSGGGGASSSW
jgi:uncharacterized protein